MTETMSFRASAMPMAFACPGSVRIEPDEIRIDTANDAASMGTAIHAVMARVVVDGLNDLPDLQPFADECGVPDESLDEFEMLCRFGMQAWRELKSYFPNPTVEESLALHSPRATGGLAAITGHVDLASNTVNEAAFLDWKSGRVDSDEYHQMAAYAAMMAVDGVEVVHGVTVRLRDRKYIVRHWAREQIVAWLDEWMNRVVEWDGTYTVGEHCRYCRRQATCDARRQIVLATVADLTGETLPAIDAGNRELMGPKVVDLYRRAKVLTKAIEQFDGWLRNEIAANGPLPTGDGKTLALVAESRDEIDPQKAWPLMADALTQDEIAACMKVGKTKLLDAVGSHAPHRGKGKAKSEFLEALRDAGAVESKEITKLREVCSES